MSPAAVLACLIGRDKVPSVRAESDHELRFIIPAHVERAGGYLYVLSSKLLRNSNRATCAVSARREAYALPPTKMVPKYCGEFGLLLKAC